MAHLITANGWFGEQGLQTWERFFLGIILANCRRYGVDLRPPSDDAPVCAVVNRGRWLIPCVCGGYEYAWEEGFYLCASCLNEHLGHRIGKSYFPAERGEIEAALLARPLSARNWNIHEAVPEFGAVQTVAELRSETLLHAGGG